MIFLKAKFFICTILLVSIISVLAVGLTSCNSDKIVVANFVEVSYSGADKEGEASYSLKKDELFDEIRGRVSEEKASNTVIEFFVEELSFKLDPNNNLSNGDTIKLTLSYSKEYAKKIDVRFSAKGKSFEVSGLE